MITKIILNRIASYKSSATLTTDKKVNLLYGLNGSGKTVLSNYLKNPDDAKYQDCQMVGFNDDQQKILVYNQSFVAENFFDADEQKGIFTLAEENKMAHDNINKAKLEKGRLEEELAKKDGELAEKTAETDKITADAENAIWEIRTNYTGGDRVFDQAGFLDGLKGSKKTLLNHLLEVDLPQEEPRDVESIKEDVRSISEAAEARSEINLLSEDIPAQIEDFPLFKEAILGSQNSPVAQLIEDLGNSDWVKHGLEYMDSEKETCPFCQEETLTKNLQSNLKNYFDEAYSRKLNQLKTAEGEYQRYKESLKLEDLTRDHFDDAQKHQIEALFSDLGRILDGNARGMERKIQSPSNIWNLASSKKAIAKINRFIAERNEEIQAFNKKLEDRENTINNLKREFWHYQRKEYNSTISNYNRAEKKLRKEMQGVSDEAARLRDEIEQQKSIIVENQTGTVSIDQTIDAINGHLRSFGISNFLIVKHEEEYYRLKREYEQDEPVFKTLSEGEKTVISFLYFAELCKGIESKADNRRKIVVIDDPISSLSHMYVFNVAQRIKDAFFDADGGEFEKIFVLTHQLYFFNELVKIANRTSVRDARKTFRITKSEEGSHIIPMAEEEIQNEYQNYWQIVKECQNGSHYPEILIANVMRNIFEYFFAFIAKKHWRKELKSTENAAFIRYMDRESHSDAANLSDSKEIDLQMWLTSFKTVFEKAGHIDHYNEYMGINKP